MKVVLWDYTCEFSPTNNHSKNTGWMLWYDEFPGFIWEYDPKDNGLFTKLFKVHLIKYQAVITSVILKKSRI